MTTFLFFCKSNINKTQIYCKFLCVYHNEVTHMTLIDERQAMNLKNEKVVFHHISTFQD